MFAPLKAVLPHPLAAMLRNTVTAFVTPIYQFARLGHFRSSFAAKAMDQRGRPIPWYSYPCVEFLAHRHFHDKRVLEFGAGQSTLWWAGVAQSVVSFEGNATWVEQLRKELPGNVTLHLRSASSADEYLPLVVEALEGAKHFDVIVIDGLFRAQLVPLALSLLAPTGAIICDNSEGYGFHEAFLSAGLLRVDFYGAAAGVVSPTVTSIMFPPLCFLFDASTPIAPPM